MRNSIGDASDIDPARVDLAEAPRRKRKRRKAKAPTWVEPFAEEALERMHKRPGSPGVMLEPNDRGGYSCASPHENEQAWELQIHDALGTRSNSIVRAFMDQLTHLVRESWHERDHRWKPSESQLNAALAFIAGTRPRNEVEAALAAQMVAVHWMTMAVSANAMKYGGSDARAAATAARLARTYAMQMEALNRSRGKRKASRQKITVKRESHVHHHQHVHVAGGSQEFGGQPHEPGEAGRPTAESPALPGANAGGIVLPMPRCTREDTVLPARRSKGFGRAGG